MRRPKKAPLRVAALKPTHNFHSLLGLRLGALALGVGLLVLSSRLFVPLLGTPVPFTWQPQMVLIVSALAPFGMGPPTVLTWLGLGLCQLPVFASAAVLGPWAFVGPTGGYLLAYAPVAFLMRRFGKTTHMGHALTWLLGSGLILLGGVAHLALFVGPAHAIRLGGAPFVLGDAIKTLLAFFVARQLKSWTQVRRL